MALSPGLFTSASEEWGTPKDLFAILDEHYKFTLDVCSSKANSLRASLPFYTKEDDALTRSWTGVWYNNPPYGRKMGLFVDKGLAEARLRCARGVYLVPARTDTRWFRRLWRQASLVVFLEGRLKYTQDGIPGGTAPFPSCLFEVAPMTPPDKQVELTDLAGLSAVLSGC